MELYTQKDFEATKRALRMRVIILVLMLAATFGTTAVFLVTRVRLGAMAALAVGMCLCYAYTSLKLLPWFYYRRYQMDMCKGLSRETEGDFVSCSQDVRLSDGVQFHEFILSLGPEEEDERMFLWDDDKAIPSIEAGQKIRIRSFGNYITALTVCAQ